MKNRVNPKKIAKLKKQAGAVREFISDTMSLLEESFTKKDYRAVATLSRVLGQVITDFAALDAADLIPDHLDRRGYTNEALAYDCALLSSRDRSSEEWGSVAYHYLTTVLAKMTDPSDITFHFRHVGEMINTSIIHPKSEPYIADCFKRAARRVVGHDRLAMEWLVVDVLDRGTTGANKALRRLIYDTAIHGKELGKNQYDYVNVYLRFLHVVDFERRKQRRRVPQSSKQQVTCGKHEKRLSKLWGSIQRRAMADTWDRIEKSGVDSAHSMFEFAHLFSKSFPALKARGRQLAASRPVPKHDPVAFEKLGQES